MKAFAVVIFGVCVIVSACTDRDGPVDAEDVTIAAPPGTARPPFRFSDDDERFLDELQIAAFRFFWDAVAPESGMVYDRTSNDLVSVAGVGFQLSALPIGVERGWVTREQAEGRALLILETLRDAPMARKYGLYFHFLEGEHGDVHPRAHEFVVSTIDSALLFAGVLTVSSYFGGEIAAVGNQLFADADWRFFADDPRKDDVYADFVSLGWRSTDKTDPIGDGELLGFTWCDNGDEHRLVTFLGICAPDPEHRIEPKVYYKLRRMLGEYGDSGPMVWFPYSGALFTSFFAHCWIDYASIGVDDPSAFGVARRPNVDWWENSRRHVNMHRVKAIENPEGFETPGLNAWGLSACDGEDGYIVGGHFPEFIPTVDAVDHIDIAEGTLAPEDRWFGGTIAPYAAGSSIMFEPDAAVAALRHYRSLQTEDGLDLVWADPSDGGFGFRDSYRLGGPGETPWVAVDYVAIDQGPMLLAIENARTGLVWRLFRAHPAVGAGLERLGLEPSSTRPENSVREVK